VKDERYLIVEVPARRAGGSKARRDFDMKDEPSILALLERELDMGIHSDSSRHCHTYITLLINYRSCS
jgi:hypothetical protein